MILLAALAWGCIEDPAPRFESDPTDAASSDQGQTEPDATNPGVDAARDAAPAEPPDATRPDGPRPPEPECVPATAVRVGRATTERVTGDRTFERHAHATSGRTHALAWHTSHHEDFALRMTVLDAQGAPIGPIRDVAQQTEHAALAWSGAEFGLAWSALDAQRIAFRRFDAQGNGQGRATHLASDEVMNRPAVAWLDDRFVLAWTETRFFGPGPGRGQQATVWLARLDPDGPRRVSVADLTDARASPSLWAQRDTLAIAIAAPAAFAGLPDRAQLFRTDRVFEDDQPLVPVELEDARAAVSPVVGCAPVCYVGVALDDGGRGSGVAVAAFAPGQPPEVTWLSQAGNQATSLSLAWHDGVLGAAWIEEETPRFVRLEPPFGSPARVDEVPWAGRGPPVSIQVVHADRGFVVSMGGPSGIFIAAEPFSCD